MSAININLSVLVTIIMLNSNLSFGQRKEKSFMGLNWFVKGVDTVYQFNGIDKHLIRSNRKFCFLSAEKYFFSQIGIDYESLDCNEAFESSEIKQWEEAIHVEVSFKDIESLLDHYLTVLNFLNSNIKDYDVINYVELNYLELNDGIGVIWEKYDEEKKRSKSIIICIKILELPLISQLNDPEFNLKGLLVLKSYTL